jgi:diguanylate cyclase (GGDEF)-like protein
MRGENFGSGVWAALLALLLALMVSSGSAHAKTSDLAPCFRIAHATDTLTSVMANRRGFDCNTDQNALNPGDYWVRFAIPENARTGNHRQIFRTASLWDAGFELWAVRADGAIEAYRPFDGQELSPMRLGATTIVTLQHDVQPITAIYARVHGSAAISGIMQQSQISGVEEALRFEMILAVCYAAFAGLCIALLVYNFALWRGMREPFLLAYCGMLLATLCYAIFASGAPHYFSTTMTGADRLRITIPLLAINAASAIIFIRYFFDSSNIPKWAANLAYAVAALVAGVGLVYAAMAPAYVKLMDALYVYSFVPMPFVALAFVCIAYKRRDPFLGYFLLAWSAPVVGFACRLLFGLNVLPYHILIENSTFIGLAFEALISSLAIGRRVQMLAIARDRAEMAEAHALKIAETDPLTGIANRRALVREILTGQRDWQLTLIDVDNFKRVNDSVGHVEGDEVLKTIALIIARLAPPGAIVARLGGEEFAIACCTDFESRGLSDADALLAEIRHTAMPGGYHVTASIGIARRIVGDENDWKILYRAADLALYRAKNSGRDRHVDHSAERIAA